jgi:plastocyanin
MKGIIIIIIIVIAVAGFLLLRDGASNTDDIMNVATDEMPTEESANNIADINVELGDISSDIDTTAEVIVVTYSDDGFAPKKISVAQGQKVRFVNKSSSNMWVASDVHPSHKIMPEFDNKESIGNGESYEFTFTKSGAWTYHNHINPNDVGTITVE